MEQEAQNKVIKIVKQYEQNMKDDSGIPSSMQEEDIREYIDQVIEEVKQAKAKR